MWTRSFCLPAWNVPKSGPCVHSNQLLVLPCLLGFRSFAARSLRQERALSFYQRIKRYRSKEGANPLFIAPGDKEKGQANHATHSVWLKLTHWLTPGQKSRHVLGRHGRRRPSAVLHCGHMVFWLCLHITTIVIVLGQRSTFGRS